MTKFIVNCETGEVIERELNAEELNQYQLDVAAAEAQQAELVAKAAQREALLERLGITEEEAKLLLGGN